MISSRWPLTVEPIHFSLRRLSLSSLLLVAIFAFTFSFLISNGIFVLNEGRTYFVNSGFVGNIDFWQYWLFPAGSNTRYTSMFFAKVVHDACGIGQSCTNIFQSALVSLQCIAFYVHSFQLLGSRPRSLMVTGLWLLSGAALSGIVWQSIQHDKIAVALIVVNLSVALTFFGNRQRAIWQNIVYAILLIISFGITFNAKEIGFFLPIAVTFFAVIFGLSYRTLTRNVITIVPSLIYSVWYILVYYVHLQGYWSEHINGGSVIAGLARLILLTLNLGVFFDIPQHSTLYQGTALVAESLYAALAIGALVLSAVYLRKAVGRLRVIPRVDVAMSLWRELYLLMMIVMFYGMFSRTAYPSSFYIMIPTWAVICLSALVIGRAARATRSPRLAAWGAYACFATPFLIAYATYYEPDGIVPTLWRASAALETTNGVIRTLVAGRPIDTIVLATDGNPSSDWYMLHGARSDAFDQDLPPYMFGAPDLRVLTSRVAPQDLPLRTPRAGELQVIVGGDYGLRFLALGNRVLFKRFDPAADDGG